MITRLTAWIAAVALLGCSGADERSTPSRVNHLSGCQSQPSCVNGPAPPPPAMPKIESAALVALSTGLLAVDVDPEAQVRADRVLSNGSIDLDARSQVTADLEAAGGVALSLNSRVTGNVRAGCRVTRLSGATITGTVTENAVVPRRRFPSTAALWASLGVSFGPSRPDIRVGRNQTLVLPGGAQTVANVNLSDGATLVIQEQSVIKANHVNIDDHAKVVVRNGGRLKLYVMNDLDLETSARLVQENQKLGQGLIVGLAPGAHFEMSSDSTFGPGLVYGATDAACEDTELDDLANVTGALVAGRIDTRNHANLDLDSRYLTCVQSSAPLPEIVLSHPVGRTERVVPPGTHQILVEGTVTGSTLDYVTLLDATSERPLAVDATGKFSAQAVIDPSEPTNVCVIARDCLGRDVRACALVSVSKDIAVHFSSPAPGAVVSVSELTVTGRVEGANPVRVVANGVSGGFTGRTFIINHVPLAPGMNQIDVEVESSSGDIVRRRLLVSRNALSARKLTLEIDAARRVRVVERSALVSIAVAPSRRGHIGYRLLDATGRELHQAGIPGTQDFASETQRADGTIASTQPRPSSTLVSAIVPMMPGAVRIEFFDEGGHFLGDGVL